jgi:site-specific recombinase XerD
MIDEFLAHLRAERYSEMTVKATGGWLERCQHHFKPKSLRALRPKDLRDWQQSLFWTPGPSGRLYSENTVNQAVGAVRLFYRWALERKLVRDDPSKDLRTRRVPDRPRQQLDEAEARAMLALLVGDKPKSLRDRALVGLLHETGIPFSACSRLDLDDLQTDTGALMASGRRAGVHTLGQGVVDDLERYLQHGRPLLLARGDSGDQALFINDWGQRMTDQVIRARLRFYRSKLARP